VADVKELHTNEASDVVAIIGLGQMGAAFGMSLRRAGFATFGFDIDQDRARLFERDGGSLLRSAGGLPDNCELVITSLPAPEALETVIGGEDGLASSGRSGVIVMEASTLPIATKESARRQLAAAGSAMLDCPVSGTAAQARVGDLTVFVSGDQATAEACGAVFEALGRSWRYLGEFGRGMKMKFVANLLIAVHNMAAAEALVLGVKAGLDAQLVYEVISDSAATSRMFEVSGPIMLNEDYEDASAKVQILHKDLQLIRAFATQAGAPTPLMSLTAEFYTSAMALGMEAFEDASVHLLLARLAGLERDFSMPPRG
jgi:putative dehydrogenase